MELCLNERYDRRNTQVDGRQSRLGQRGNGQMEPTVRTFSLFQQRFTFLWRFLSLMQPSVDFEWNADIEAK